MISPEKLKMYPFFGPFSTEQLRQVAMLAEEFEIKKGDLLFEECQPATTFYLLKKGGVDLFYKSEEEYHPKERKEFEVGVINPGEVFAFSALIDPHVLNASARASADSQIIKINAEEWRALFENDPRMGYIAMQQLNKVIMERLAYTRVQLAAAWA